MGSGRMARAKPNRRVGLAESESHARSNHDGCGTDRRATSRPRAPRLSGVPAGAGRSRQIEREVTRLVVRLLVIGDREPSVTKLAREYFDLTRTKSTGAGTGMPYLNLDINYFEHPKTRRLI